MPSSFGRIIAELKRRERRLAALLTGIRTAIASLEFGGAGVPAPAIIETPHATRVEGSRRATLQKSAKPQKRRMSPAARKAVSLRMKRYWAARRRARSRSR
jgi:ParB-like chromosome segregation protein Spo0J